MLSILVTPIYDSEGDFALIEYGICLTCETWLLFRAFQIGCGFCQKAYMRATELFADLFSTLFRHEQGMKSLLLTECLLRYGSTQGVARAVTMGLELQSFSVQVSCES